MEMPASVTKISGHVVPDSVLDCGLKFGNVRLQTLSRFLSGSDVLFTWYVLYIPGERLWYRARVTTEMNQ